MNRALYTAATGLAAQQLNLDVISNNLANANTVGFKRMRADFQDLLYQTQSEPGAQTGPNSMLPTGTQIGLGVSTGTTSASYTQGTFQDSGGTYDVAIQGDGFFKILMPDGSTAYTRSGNFNVDGTGKLVTADGYAVQPDITIPPNKTSVSISPEGQVSVTLPGQSAPQVVGQIQIATFPNPAGLRLLGGNRYQITAASGQPTESAPGQGGGGSLAQHVLESSNVNIVEEMVRMIITQRSYDTNSKVIQAADEMLGTTNSLKR